ncbi:SET domain-containing protein, partial [Schizopora paradoxa]
MSRSKAQCVEAFFKFCEESGIKIDDAIQVRVIHEDATRDSAVDEEQIAVYSKDAYIECGTRLACIPKSSILSIRNSIFSDIWRDETARYGTDGLCALALALYGEVLNGTRSPWHGYLSSLPEKTNIALLWHGAGEDDREALMWIRGTMVERERFEGAFHEAQGGSKLVSDIISNYYATTAVPALVNAGFGERSSEEDFMHAFALASSRAFIVDNFHGLAMVPIADAFNHSLQNHVHLEAFHDVCPVCGSVDECVHDDEDEDNDARAVQVKAMPSAAERSASSMFDHGSQENTECCDMVANAAITPHTEVFNVYNDRLTNAQLLTHYGFTLDSNENDVIAWELRSLCLQVPSLISRLSFENNGGGAVRRSEITDIGEIEQAFGDRCTGFGVGIDRNVHENSNGAAVGDPFVKETVEERRAEARESDLNVETQAFLDRLLEVVAAWPHSGGIWKSSMLVYDPTDVPQRSIPEPQALSQSDGSLAGVTRGQSHFEPGPTLGFLTSSANEAANVKKIQSDLSSEALGSGLSENMNRNMLHVDVARSGSNRTTDLETVASKEPGLASREVLQARVKLDYKLDGTRVSQTMFAEKSSGCVFLLNDEAKMTHHLWIFCALLILQTLKDRGSLSHLRGTSFEEPHGSLTRPVANRAAVDIEASRDSDETHQHSSMSLKEEIELLKHIARSQMRAETIDEDLTQEDRDGEFEGSSLVSTECLLAEDDAGDAMDFVPLDDSVVRSELEGALRNIDTCEDPLLPPPGNLGSAINISDEMPSTPTYSNFGRENVSSGPVRLSFDDVPTGRNESIHTELATRESSSAGDTRDTILNSMASMSNHGVVASNASCPTIRHRHQPSLLRDVDAAEPSVDDSGRLSVYAPGNQPAEARSSHVVGQTKDMLEFTQSDIEDDAEVRHTGRGCASRRDDGDDDDKVGNIRSKHGRMPTPQIIPHTIYNAFEEALGQN